MSSNRTRSKSPAAQPVELRRSPRKKAWASPSKTPTRNALANSVFRFLPDEAFNPGVRHDVIRAFTVAAAGTLTLADRIGDRLSEIKLAEAARAAALASSLPTVKVGIIGGTGLEDPQILENARLIDNVDTPYGKISDKMLEGSIHGVECVILSRDGRAHDINPSNINYRANLWALADQGVTVIIASTACGSLQENVKPGDLLFPDSVYDRTFGRKITFFDGEDGHQPGVCHIPMHPLYHEPLRQILISTAKSLQSSMPDLALHEDGFGVCIEGPRFLTRAESRVFRSWGAAIVNMTMIPEGPLAKELGIPYAPVALITDYDCWKDDAEHVSVEVVSATLRATADKAKRLFIEAIKELKK